MCSLHRKLPIYYTVIRICEPVFHEFFPWIKYIGERLEQEIIDNKNQRVQIEQIIDTRFENKSIYGDTARNSLGVGKVC